MKKIIISSILLILLWACSKSKPAFDPSTLNSSPHAKEQKITSTNSVSTSTGGTSSGATNTSATHSWSINSITTTWTGKTNITNQELLNKKDSTSSGVSIPPTTVSGSTVVSTPLAHGQTWVKNPAEPAWDTSSLSSISKAKLHAIANHTIEEVTKWQWEKKLEITKADSTGKAVIWSFSANGKWSWIGWKADDGSWKIFVNMNWFQCSELDTIPQQFAEFFKDTITKEGKRNCK